MVLSGDSTEGEKIGREKQLSYLPRLTPVNLT